jgi:hypothetical protein
MDIDGRAAAYRTVIRSVRPAVTFVDAGPDWRADVLRTIEGYSRTRGNVERAIEPHSDVKWITSLHRADAPAMPPESEVWALTC